MKFYFNYSTNIYWALTRYKGLCQDRVEMQTFPLPLTESNSSVKVKGAIRETERIDKQINKWIEKTTTKYDWRKLTVLAVDNVGRNLLQTGSSGKSP